MKDQKPLINEKLEELKRETLKQLAIFPDDAYVHMVDKFIRLYCAQPSKGTDTEQYIAGYQEGFKNGSEITCPSVESKGMVEKEEIRELLNTALHGIRAFASYGHGAALTANGNITDSHLQRAQDAINKALIRLHTHKEGSSAEVEELAELYEKKQL